jgi:hypothetical protein
MLQSISSPRREAASPPHQDVPYSKKANTLASLQLHVNILQLQNVSQLIFKRAGDWMLDDSEGGACLAHGVLARAVGEVMLAILGP